MMLDVAASEGDNWLLSGQGQLLTGWDGLVCELSGQGIQMLLLLILMLLLRMVLILLWLILRAGYSPCWSRNFFTRAYDDLLLGRWAVQRGNRRWRVWLEQLRRLKHLLRLVLILLLIIRWWHVSILKHFKLLLVILVTLVVMMMMAAWGMGLAELGLYRLLWVPLEGNRRWGFSFRLILLQLMRLIPSMVLWWVHHVTVLLRIHILIR